MHNTPLEDQKPFHMCTSAVYLHHAAVTCQDEQQVWPSCMLSSQQQLLSDLLVELAANHYQAQGSASVKNQLIPSAGEQLCKIYLIGR